MKIFSPILKGTTTVVQGTTNLSGSFTGSLFGTAATASYADNFTVGGTLTAQTINVQIITSSIEFNTGSTRNGSLSTNTHQFTGSVLMSGSLTVNGPALPIVIASNSTTELYTEYRYNTSTVVGYIGNGTGVVSIASGSDFGVRAQNNLLFAAGGNNERMRITSGGSLLMAKDAAIGINTADGADNGYLALCGASADGENRGGYIYLSGNERVSDPGMVVIGAGNVIGIGSVIAFRTGAGVERMRIIGNGRVLIGTTTDAGYLLYVNGNAAGTSGFANVSDNRFKKDITPIENALTKINQLNGISFNWDKDSRPDLNLDDNNHLGLIAQDVEEILPQVVTTGEDELKTKTITYSDIIPVLIEAIKELKSENDTLKEILQRNNIQ
jgi:hypothetical protein